MGSSSRLARAADGVAGRRCRWDDARSRSGAAPSQAARGRANTDRRRSASPPRGSRRRAWVFVNGRLSPAIVHSCGGVFQNRSNRNDPSRQDLFWGDVHYSWRSEGNRHRPHANGIVERSGFVRGGARHAPRVTNSKSVLIAQSPSACAAGDYAFTRITTGCAARAERRAIAHRSTAARASPGGRTLDDHHKPGCHPGISNSAKGVVRRASESAPQASRVCEPSVPQASRLCGSCGKT